MTAATYDLTQEHDSVASTKVFRSYFPQATSLIEPPAMGIWSDPRTSTEAARGLYAVMKVFADESFEDGVESKLGKRLRTLLAKFGEELVRSFSTAVGSATTSPAAISEALTQLGAFRDGVTEETRLRLLLAFIDHPNSLVRYGATCGLWELRDRRAAEALLRRADREPNALVRSTLLAAGEDLS